MKRHSILALVLAGLFTSAMSLGISASADASDIHNIGNSKCLQPINGSMELGAAIVQKSCDASAAQDWTLISLGGTRYRFKSRLSGLCLDARGGATNGTPVVQWICNGISNEIWDTRFSPFPLPAVVTITSRVSGTTSHCLDVPGNQDLDGLAMQLWRCNDTRAQLWGLR
ncbi:MAG: RICIN domain-containing protein [Solirubrobacteraceae bacterium]